ncbi:MAG: hypothetical protein U9R68_11040 [Planctomycetota bacterium]|nr:hypothetical protein [Planctomycetota bacterium]
MTMKRTTRRTLCHLAAAAVVLAAAGSARAGFSDILRRVRDELGRGLLAHDVLARPGEAVTLRASLRGGFRLEGVQGVRIQFHLRERRLGEGTSGGNGDVEAPWTAPAEPGDYAVRVRVKPADQPDDEDDHVAPARLLVAVRKPESPLAIVDLDKTLVASGFHRVLLGGGRAEPMDGSRLVLARLARTHTIVYLTHRPDFLGPTSKNWLQRHGYPLGPVLTSTLGGLMDGSGAYKTRRLADLARNFKNLKVGIGDKVSDARAYAAQGLTSILILHVDWSEDDPEDYEDLAAELAALPDSVHVATNWSAVAEVLFDGSDRPPGPMIRRLRRVAADLRRRGED